MKLCQNFSFMATFLRAKYDRNSTGGSKDINTYAIFGHFFVLVCKMYHCPKKNGHKNFVPLSISFSKICSTWF